MHRIKKNTITLLEINKLKSQTGSIPRKKQIQINILSCFHLLFPFHQSPQFFFFPVKQIAVVHDRRLPLLRQNHRHLLINRRRLVIGHLARKKLFYLNIFPINLKFTCFGRFVAFSTFFRFFFTFLRLFLED